MDFLYSNWWIFPLVALFVGVGLFFKQRKTSSNASAVVVSTGIPALQEISPRETSSVYAGDAKKLPKAQLRRRAAGIAGYVGFNGSGKSATMVYDTLPDLEAGRQVLSTVAFLSPTLASTPEDATQAWEAIGVPELQPADNPLTLPHPLWIPFTDFRQMIDFKHGVICMDEVTGIADSRDSMGLPVQVRNKLFQLRRDDVTLRWTTIDWSASDKRIRNATQVVSFCKGFLPKVEPGKVWATKRFFWIRTYDARGFDDFTEARNRVNEKNRPKPMAHQFLRLHGGLKKAIESYDSLAQVLSLGASSEAGLCMTCGGGRRRKTCSCPDHAKPAKGNQAQAPSPTGGAAAVETGLDAHADCVTGSADSDVPPPPDTEIDD